MANVFELVQRKLSSNSISSTKHPQRDTMSTGKLVAIILGVCGGVGVLLIAICSGLFYAGYKNADAAVSPKIDAMCVAIVNEDLVTSYANETTTEFKNVVSEEQFVASGKDIALRLGTLKTKSMRGFKLKQHNAKSYIDVSYAAVFEKGNGTIIATLNKQNGEWKFVGFRVNSPVFKQEKCPSCGEPHSTTAKFCPACGASLANQFEDGEANLPPVAGDPDNYKPEVPY